MPCVQATSRSACISAGGLEVEGNPRAMADQLGAASHIGAAASPSAGLLSTLSSSTSTSTSALRRHLLEALPEGAGLLLGAPGNIPSGSPEGQLVPVKVGSFNGCSTPRDAENSDTSLGRMLGAGVTPGHPSPPPTPTQVRRRQGSIRKTRTILRPHQRGLLPLLLHLRCPLSGS